MRWKGRNNYKAGDWLVVDDESGFTRYASDVIRDEYSKFTDRGYAESRHPSESVRPDRDPKPIRPIRQGW